MNKRGISAIVATVLIVLISIVGVGIIWGGILPLFKDLNYLSYSDIKLEIITQGYTVYDPEMHFAFVQIGRGKDNLNLTAIEIVFNINGSSVFYRNYDFPNKNEKKTYKFNFTRNRIEGAPSEVSVAPVFSLNGQERVGELLSTKKIPNQKIDLSEPEWVLFNNQSITSIVRGNYSEGGTTTTNNNTNNNPDAVVWTSVNACAVLNETGGKYKLGRDLGVNEVNLFEGACFLIEADDIVFNLDGHSVTGSGVLQRKGIYIMNRTGVEIKNGGIYQFGWGVYVRLGVNNTLKGLNLSSNGAGIYFSNSSENTIQNVTSRDNLILGLVDDSGRRSIIKDNNFCGNMIFGLGAQIFTDNHCTNQSGFAGEGACLSCS